MPAALDSYFKAVEARMAVINPDREVVGMVSAQDWPGQDVKFEAFYCLSLTTSPLGRQAYSPASLFYVSHVQWVWMIMGTDVQQGIRGRNRGDRYRTNRLMEAELLKALYPYFAPKAHWSIDANGTLVSTPSDPEDNIWWTPPVFVQKSDKDSGLVYSSAASMVTEITESIAA